MRSHWTFSRETLPLADALKRVLGASACKRERAGMVTAMTTTHAAEPVKPRSSRLSQPAQLASSQHLPAIHIVTEPGSAMRKAHIHTLLSYYKN